jgi:hypothetical protein
MKNECAQEPPMCSATDCAGDENTLKCSKDEVKDCRCCPAKVDCSIDDCKGKDSKCAADKLQGCKCQDGNKDTTPVIGDPAPPLPNQGAIDDLAWGIFQDVFNGDEKLLNPDSTDTVQLQARLSCADPSVSEVFNRDGAVSMVQRACQILHDQKFKLSNPAPPGSNQIYMAREKDIHLVNNYAEVQVQVNATAESCDAGHGMNDPVSLDFSTLSVDECLSNWLAALDNCPGFVNPGVQYWKYGGIARSKCISWSILGVHTGVL